MKPVAWGGTSGVGKWIVSKNQIYPWLTKPLYTADQLREAQVKALREAAENAPSAWVESVDKYLLRMADELEKQI